MTQYEIDFDGTTNPPTRPFSIGRQSKIANIGNDGGRRFDGNIAEIIGYNAHATAVEISRVESYLAIKYGVTLNPNVILENTNATRSEILEELNFLTIANNGSALDWSSMPANRVFNCICSNAEGITRIWEVTEVTTATATDAQNDVYVAIPASKLGRNNNPAPGSDPLSNLAPQENYTALYMLIDRNAGADFTNTSFEIVPMVLNADNIYVTNQAVDLDDNDRFTFGFITSSPRMRHGKQIVFDRMIAPYQSGTTN